MKTRIIIHATGTPSDLKVTIDGTIMKGRRDKELCGHCRKFPVTACLSHTPAASTLQPPAL